MKISLLLIVGAVSYGMPSSSTTMPCFPTTIVADAIWEREEEDKKEEDPENNPIIMLPM